MINSLHKLLHNPRSGWDPISEEHARLYNEEQLKTFDDGLLDKLEGKLGALKNLRVLDLGGGPGRYSIAFAARGANVTWHDISQRYLELAKRKCKERALNVNFSLGYLEEAMLLPKEAFDLVFMRICWRYNENDRSFSEILYSLIAPGGAAYIDTNVGPDQGSALFHKITYQLNRYFRWKIGHPNPPPGRLSRDFSLLSAIVEDFGSSDQNDRILVVKPAILAQRERD